MIYRCLLLLVNSMYIQVVMDWHLVLGVSILVGVIMFIIILGVAVPPLRPLPQLVPDTERPIGRTVRINYFIQ